MNSEAIKSLVACAFGVLALAGCASSPSSSSSSAPTAASAQGGVRTGKVTAVETTTIVDRAVTGTSSGGSRTVTSASGGPSLLVVQFNDGTQGRYVIENPVAPHAVGETVYVITSGDRIGIMPQK